MLTTMRSDGIASCGVVEVTDLVASDISGGAVFGIVASAGMFSDATAWTITSASSTTLPSGESIVEGTGMVVKVGDNQAVNVQVFDVKGQPLAPAQLNFFKQKYAAFLNYCPQFRGLML